MKYAGSSQARGRASTALALLAGAAVLLAVSPAWAAGAGTAMPWEGPLDTIMQSLSGPVAKAEWDGRTTGRPSGDPARVYAPIPWKSSSRC